MAVFVRGAIRDEVTDIRIEHVGHSAAWGHAERVTKLSMAGSRTAPIMGLAAAASSGT